MMLRGVSDSDFNKTSIGGPTPKQQMKFSAPSFHTLLARFLTVLSSLALLGLAQPLPLTPVPNAYQGSAPGEIIPPPKKPVSMWEPWPWRTSRCASREPSPS